MKGSGVDAQIIGGFGHNNLQLSNNFGQPANPLADWHRQTAEQNQRQQEMFDRMPKTISISDRDGNLVTGTEVKSPGVRKCVRTSNHVDDVTCE